MRLQRWLLGMLFMACLAGGSHAAERTTLRVQLNWLDQAQFAGFYVADRKGFFAEEGVDVVTLAGGPDLDPVSVLRSGKADLITYQYFTALQHAGDTDPLINIAQVFEKPPMRLMCRSESGVRSLKDVSGKIVAVGLEQDQLVVEEMLANAGAANEKPQFIRRGSGVAALIEGRADCVTGEVYNEYRQLLRAGHFHQPLAIFKPSDFGVVNVEDGLYVLQSRLVDPVFVDRLAHLVRGLRRGWEDVRQYPNEALNITLSRNPALDRTDQQEMLEGVISLLRAEDVLYLDPALVETKHGPATPPWTHAVWNRVLELDGKTETFRRATLFQAGLDEKSHIFGLLLMFGFCAFALAATLDAVSQGYDLWGRLVIALVSVMGGGVLRDLILARNRLPFSFLEDPAVPIAITTVVIAFSLLLIIWPDSGRTRAWLVIRRYCEAIGFGIITVYGALACILSGANWYWAPFGAAMTIAGGGILRDILVNREPRNFRGAIFEEIAVLSGLLVVIGLVVASRFEHSAWVVHALLAGTVVVITTLRLLVVKYDLRYPRWLAQPAPSA